MEASKGRCWWAGSGSRAVADAANASDAVIGETDHEEARYRVESARWHDVSV